MDLSDRRSRGNIHLASQIVLKLSNTIDVSKDNKEKRDVANNVVIFIDAIKDHLVQTELKQDLNDLSECVYHQPPDDEGKDCSAAISLLGTCSGNDYTTIADSILAQFDVCQDELSSSYHMTKQCPNFVETQLNVQDLSGEAESPEEADSNQLILEEAASSQPIVVNQPVCVDQLEGGYEAGMKIMLRKTRKKNKNKNKKGNLMTL